MTEPPVGRPIDLPKSFKKRLRKKTTAQQAAIIECIYRLQQNHRHPGLHSHKMKGLDGVFEAYVDGANRVTYHWDEGVIVFRNHCNHDMLERNP